MPTRDTPWPAGTPCWVDYGAADLDATKSFYADLLGWTYTGGEPEFGGYLQCEKNGLAAGGMGPQQDPNDPPRWTTYFATDDANVTATRITDAGGTVLVAPMEVGPMGTMMIALDPQGNPFGVWQSGLNTGVRIYNEPGALVWNEAAVEDPDAARAFYSAVFDFRFTEMEGMGGYTTFAAGGDAIGGLSSLTEGVAKGWSACFSVPSADDAVATVQSAGGTVTMPAEDTPFGRFAVVQDPWGAAFSVLEDTSGESS